MERPAVLVVEPDAELRRALSLGLAEAGYEVVPAESPEEGQRFAAGIGPAVVVTASAAMGDAARLPEWLPEDDDPGRTLVLLGQAPEADPDLPDEVLYLPVPGLDSQDLVRRIRLLLVGREVGLEADERFAALVGDLSLTPLFELVRALKRSRVSGVLELASGTVFLRRGEVIAARSGSATGRKAFSRLGRLSDGPFRVRLETPTVDPEIEVDLSSLIIDAIEEGQLDFPPQRSRLAVRMEPGFFSRSFEPRQQELLAAIGEGATLREVLDRLSWTDGEAMQAILDLEELGVVEREDPEPGVQVITDSTADLPPDVAREHGIRVVPLTVHFGKRTFYDRVDLQPREFYELLSRGPTHPRSSPPSVEEFSGYYRDVVGRRDVLSIHLSDEMSLTAEHAEAARRQELGDDPELLAADDVHQLRVVDSRQVSLGLGLPVLCAARMAARGEPLERVVALVEDLLGRMQVLFVVDTLEYLARGGRIGRARALIGGLLRIKPILSIEDGIVVPVDRVRGRRRALPRILELLRARLEPGRPVLAGVAHAKAPVWADQVARRIEEEFDVRELLIAEMGPVVGTHVGPGCVGVAVVQPTDAQLPWIRRP